MSACKTLVLTSVYTARFHVSAAFSALSIPCWNSFSIPRLFFSPAQGLRTEPYKASSRRCYSCVSGAIEYENTDSIEEEAYSIPENVELELPEDSCKDTVEELLTKIGCQDDVSRFMNMERRLQVEALQGTEPWFPYLDKFKAGNGVYLNSGQVLEALNPYIMDTRKERFRNAVKNRSYSVSLVVEGLCDFGNVSAAFRSADALGFQSVHVLSCNSSKRCNNI